MRLTAAVLLVFATFTLVGCNQLGGTEKIRRRISLSKQVDAVKTGSADAIIWFEDHANSQDFLQIQDMKGLRRLEFQGGRLVVNDWWLLGLLPDLEHLKVTNSEANDRAAELLATPTSKLRILNLEAAKITDVGLEPLAKLPHLEFLRLQSPNITDAGLATLAKFPALRQLHLIDPAITDHGLKHFYSLPQLESLYLDRTQVSEQALSDLIKARPDLHLHLDQAHLPDDPNAHAH